ncbi:MAG TPA: DUF2630 family protein [Candidatus Limnocylindrales bacterium]|jgi:hypothetical protein
MSQQDPFAYINELSAEEERLYAKAGDGAGLSVQERARLDEIKVELDRCFDLLHQRQARADAGLDPAAARLRSAKVVEGYEQ